MNDRELLELAAKAAGYDTSHSWNAERLQLEPPQIGLCIPNVSTCWNPLADDGDALRLAVNLRIFVHFMDFKAFAFNQFGQSIEEMREDPFEATRRSIVKAAAEIGKGMQ